MTAQEEKTKNKPILYFLCHFQTQRENGVYTKFKNKHKNFNKNIKQLSLKNNHSHLTENLINKSKAVIAYIHK